MTLRDIIFSSDHSDCEKRSANELLKNGADIDTEVTLVPFKNGNIVTLKEPKNVRNTILCVKQ